jgi:phytanoyl-CoA hydroxylase
MNGCPSERCLLSGFARRRLGKNAIATETTSTSSVLSFARSERLAIDSGRLTRDARTVDSRPSTGAIGAPDALATDGYFRVNGFLSGVECQRVLDAVEQLLRSGHQPARFEKNLPTSLPPELRVSKLYRFHRQEPFFSFCTSQRLLAYLQPMFSGTISVFLSQAVWKVPGALGQPWHQDSSIFPFEPARPVVAAWIALTEANEETSCLRVVPGSHLTPIAEHGRDRKSPTEGRYVAMVDQNTDGYVSLEMAPGDMVLFDSHLVHSSSDNAGSTSRVALCFHYAAADTVDHTSERLGSSPYNDWMTTVTP